MIRWNEKLQLAGLRATNQRMAMMDALFGAGEPCHVTADGLFARLRDRGVKISLATVYNTLHALTRAGLLHQVSFDTGRVWFDTNTEPHFHLYDEDTDELSDIPVQALPAFDLPPHKAVKRVELVVRVGGAT